MKNMTKRHRTIVFWACTAIFFILAPAIFFYSQGYRVDLTAKRITQTGALYIKTKPSGARILINGKPAKKTDAIFGSTLEDNLLPGTYAIQVTKDGYQSWERNLNVIPKQVTEAKAITLFPEQLPSRILFENIERIWPSPSFSTAIIQRRIATGSWELAWLNINDGTSFPFLSQKGSAHSVLDVQWEDSGERVLVSQFRSEHKEYILASRSSKDGISCTTNPCVQTLPMQDAINAQLLPSSLHSIAILSYSRATSALSVLDYTSSAPASSIASGPLAFQMDGTTAFWVLEDGSLWKRELSSAQAQPQRIASLGISLSPEKLIALFPIHGTLFMQYGEDLLVEQDDLGVFDPMFSNFSSLQLSPDQNKVLIQTGSELWLVYLRATNDQPKRSAYEKVFLTRLSPPLRPIAWMNPQYVLMAAGATVQALDIETRDGIRASKLLDLQTPQDSLFWNPSSQTIMSLQQGNLSLSQKVLP